MEQPTVGFSKAVETPMHHNGLAWCAPTCAILSSALSVLCTTLPSGDANENSAPVLVLNSDTTSRAVDAEADLADPVQHRIHVRENHVFHLLDSPVGIDDIEHIATRGHLTPCSQMSCLRERRYLGIKLKQIKAPV
jgi:hypothetical protein